MPNKLTTDQFIEKAKEVHGDRYEYSKTNYIDNKKTKSVIICNKHGEFSQTPSSHLRGSGCPPCGKIQSLTKKRLSIEIFIETAKAIHGNRYDYSKSLYTGSDKKIVIICRTHGEFEQVAGKHSKGQNCPKCCRDSQKSNTKDFIEKAIKMHEYRYDYSKVDYTNNHTKVAITCKEHGEFLQTPQSHLSGKHCSKCSGNCKYTTDEFIEKAKTIHGQRYDYSKVKYVKTNEKVSIICKEHGEFNQTPNSHLSCNGCPKCGGNHKYTTDEFIEKAKAVHGQRYDYSKSVYKDAFSKITISCLIHGEFLQMAYLHKSGCGCSSCNSSKGENTIRKFLTKLEFKITNTMIKI